MIKFILIVFLVLVSIKLGIGILAGNLYRSKKITSAEHDYYSSYEYILDEITKLFKHE